MRTIYIVILAVVIVAAIVTPTVFWVLKPETSETSTPTIETTAVAFALVQLPLKKRPFVWAWIYSTKSGEVAELLSRFGGRTIDVVSPDWYYLTEGLSLGLYYERGAEDPGFVKLTKDLGILIVPMVVSSKGDRVKNLITSREAIERFSRQLIETAARMGYSGFNIDFEVSIPLYSREFAEFVDYLAKRLHEAGLILTVAVPAKRAEIHSDYLMTYDYQLLAKTDADYIMIMAYDYYEIRGPKPVAPLPWVEDCIKYSLRFFPREKLVLGVPNYGKVWDSDGRLVKWLLHQDYLSMVSRGERFVVDLSSRELMAKTAEGVAYYVDGEMAYYRAKLALSYRLAGVAIWRLDGGDPSLWELLEDFRPSLTGPPDYPLAKWIEAYPGNYQKSNRTEVNWVVVHVTEGSAQSAINWFLDPQAGVSAHYIVSLGGSVYQMVMEKDVAWHAGNKQYNLLSVGIEHEGFVKARMFTESQYRASARLTAYLAYKYGIPLARVDGIAPPDPVKSKGIIGHDQVPDPRDPTKGGGISHHTDPGPYWDWRLYMELAKKYYEALVSGNYERAFVAVWWGVYSDKWSANRDVWLKQVNEALAKLKRAGVDAVFFLVKDPWGYVYYNSSYAPMNPKYSWDVLGDVVNVAKRYGIEVYVYINALSEGETSPGFYLQQNPHFALYDEYGNMLGWVDPYCEEYVQRLLDIVAEILTKYPEVRGIQLDRIRAPQSDVVGKCSSEEFRKQYGKNPKDDMRLYQKFLVDGITSIVKRVSALAKSVRPGVHVSAAVFPSPTAVYTVLQDWVSWVNEGVVDAVATMTYTVDFTTFKSYVTSQLGSIKDPSKLLIGIGAWQLLDEMLVSQLSYAIEELNLRGAVLFNLDSLIYRNQAETLTKFRLTYYCR
ncbi:MAG: N-acetylmuramoyl-L-alanine amidase [Sulfolobales archaeon]